MDAEGARLVGEVLADNPHLKCVFLDSNPLGNHGVTLLLLESAKAAQALEHLTMDHVDADNGVVPYLLATMQARATSCGVLHRDEQVTPLTVSLHGNSISTASLEYLASQLPRSSTDRIVCDMRVVQNGEMRTQCLSEYFANYARQGGKGDLNMDCVGVDHEGAAQITAHLGNDRSPVEALRLGSNSLLDEGAAMLGEALRNNSTLRALALDSNNIGCWGFSALTNALVHSNTSLQWLELGGNPIFGDSNSSSFTETLDQLGRLLARSVGLKYLGLSHTGLCDGGCGVVAAALAKTQEASHFWTWMITRYQTRALLHLPMVWSRIRRCTTSACPTIRLVNSEQPRFHGALKFVSGKEAAFIECGWLGTRWKAVSSPDAWSKRHSGTRTALWRCLHTCTRCYSLMTIDRPEASVLHVSISVIPVIPSCTDTMEDLHTPGEIRNLTVKINQITLDTAGYNSVEKTEIVLSKFQTETQAEIDVGQS